MHAIMDKTVVGGLKSIGNTMTVRKIPHGNREQLQNFMQSDPVLLVKLTLRCFFHLNGSQVRRKFAFLNCH